MSSPVTHALLSPSSSERWLHCTPSAKLEQYEPSTYSPYAQEGIEAHALAEIKLSYMLGQINDEQYVTEFDAFKLNSKFYNTDFNDYVNEYCVEVMTIIKEDYAGQEVIVNLEDKVDFSDIVPNGSGTSDVVVIGKTFIHIIDLKFGKGVAVSAVDNSQLKLYALGALRKYMRYGIFTEAIMTICQPRLHNNSTFRAKVAELNEWGEVFVKPKAQLAIAGQGELIPGDHCKFCKLRGKCKARGDFQLAQAQQEFNTVVVEENILEPKNMTPEMLSRIMYIAPKFEAWFSDVKKYVTEAMINTELKVPGFKVVEGRSCRIITSPDLVVEKLTEHGFEYSELIEKPKILGLTALEKVVGKKTLENLCSEYIIKPAGKPTVVLETDRREALDIRQLKLTGCEFDEEEIIEE